MSPTRLLPLLALNCWLVAAPVAAAPALPRAFIADLEALQQRLQQGDARSVSERARIQAERLAGGNAADRWARALYLQLAAGAELEQGRPAVAADRLREARETPGVAADQRDRWQREEARLRLADGQTAAGAELLADWLGRHDGESRDHWRLARALAELERRESAADRVSVALAATPEPDADQQALASAIYRRAGRGEAALALVEADLAASSDPAAWRQAAALAQRLGEPGRAAAIWEAGWRKGVLTGRDDLQRLVRLHLAGGTPARAAEQLERALGEGELADDEANRRLLARAWEAARDRERALAAWESVAERSDSGDDWLHLGQLAHAWGHGELAERALRQASERGRAEAERWLEALAAAGTAGEPARD